MVLVVTETYVPTEDFLALGVTEQLPHQIFTRRLLECYSTDDKADAVAGRFFPLSCCLLLSRVNYFVSFADILL